MIWPSTSVNSCIVIINKCTSVTSEALSPRTSPRNVISNSTSTAHNLQNSFRSHDLFLEICMIRNITDLNPVDLLAGGTHVWVLITCLTIVRIPALKSSCSKSYFQDIGNWPRLAIVTICSNTIETNLFGTQLKPVMRIMLLQFSMFSVIFCLQRPCDFQIVGCWRSCHFLESEI